MSPEDAIIKKIIEDKKLLIGRDLRKLVKESEKSSRTLLVTAIAEGYLDKSVLGEAIASFYNVKFVDLEKNKPDKEIAQMFSQEYSENFRTILCAVTETSVQIVTDNPEDPRMKETMSEIFPEREVSISYSIPSDIDEGLKLFRVTVDAEFPSLLKKFGGDIPTIFDAIITDALKYDTSDIHFEPRGVETLVRFRVDGVLSEAGRLPEGIYENLLNFLKIRNNIRTDVHLQAQDGSMRIEKNRIIYDLRTSIVPTIQGETTVMRILASYVKVMSLQDIGLSNEYQDIIAQAANKPYGLVIISGPTGSGKTTTLYSLLKSLNSQGVNITTIEDPVEFRIPSVNQIQVNPETDLTFAKGLRALVRQDPDVILVGEIRDSETAEIAVNAALTGIMIFTSFHAGDAAITIPRLLDMGIEPFLLASSVELIVAQRLLRKICSHCRAEEPTTIKELSKTIKKPERFFKGTSVALYKGQGCEKCNGTGYSGRLAIFETIEMTPQIRDLIVKGPSAQDIWKIARKNGSISLFEAGVIKLLEGETTLDELMKVAQPHDI
ncbi:type II/IV secretion system protein [Candidatus Nomurabacteria bacterium]|uniref:Type II/IV secretion system protein n=1 Tax=Candidatus Dojkabacteria bacterium TaxID=2099670 RepID=A0A955KXU8_9BACT|nr:type II/IV secretion system protein [Candidatus Dojkabacteria bacterium]MCB9790047.1 type II/IV secretion system protein [Candidatus Nomurabacteria bacterium]